MQKRNGIHTRVTGTVRWLLAALLLLLCGTALGGTKHYYYTDPQGTPLAKADAQGNIVERYEYTPYGVPVPSVGAAPNGPGYTGHVNDPEAGLVYMQARYYDPAVGRFLSIDPISPSAGNTFIFNRYGYVNNNPAVNIDPDGKQCYGYGTHVPDCGSKILDCHQTNSCKSVAEANDIVRRDAKTIVVMQATIAATAASAAVLTSEVAVAAPARKVLCTYMMLCTHEPYPPNPKYNPLRPPGETQMVDQMKKIEELWQRTRGYLKDKSVTPTEPKPAPLPPPPPPSLPLTQ